MKKALILTGLLALGLTSVQAQTNVGSNPTFTNTDDYATTTNPLKLANGDYVMGADGYIVTVWLSNNNQGDYALVGAGELSDTWPSDSYGLYAVPTNLGSVWLDSSEIFDVHIRVFKYGNESLDYDQVHDLYDNGSVAGRWQTLISGSDEFTYGEYTYQQQAGATGRITGSTSTHQGSDLTWYTVNSSVPEPSTYAALAGLAVLAYVAVRRRR
ncbi:putative globular PEP-CTERM protein [Geminisphaera colitermitum]|uniref:putative globular PEP-CTERM protein n=1 Tax=Geminisphaera colitermitum TaxID=1148786 RepID=UPI000158D249|nr:putative globular PEP-CTERM protein [Geminisphaera colitermitum]